LGKCSLIKIPNSYFNPFKQKIIVLRISGDRLVRRQRMNASKVPYVEQVPTGIFRNTLQACVNLPRTGNKP
jgi:hypothetical protein